MNFRDWKLWVALVLALGVGIYYILSAAGVITPAGTPPAGPGLAPPPITVPAGLAPDLNRALQALADGQAAQAAAIGRLEAALAAVQAALAAGSTGGTGTGATPPAPYSAPDLAAMMAAIQEVRAEQARLREEQDSNFWLQSGD